MGGCGAAVLGAGVIALIASGKPGFDLVASAFTLDGYDAHSLGGYSAIIAFVVEALLTGGFLMVLIGAIDARSAAPFAPLSIGLALTLLHLILIPISNTSANLARSTGLTLFVGGWALSWPFGLAPLTDAVVAGRTRCWLFSHEARETIIGRAASAQ